MTENNNIKSLTNNLSPALRKHFCKNYNIPIKISEDPYFTDRCILFNEVFGVEDKLREYVFDISTYDSEQDFLEADNKIMQAIIDFLKSNDKMIYFSQKEDMNQFAVPERYRNMSSKDVWRDSCVDKVFLSIDLKKANFQALKYYSNDIFDGAKTWEEFVNKFTHDKSKINSKHLRQVIFGCINPKRQTILEKYMMCKVLERIGPIISNEDIYSLCTDEIVIDVGEKFISQLGTLISFIKGQIKTLDFDCHINLFSVKKIGKDMYKQMFIGGFSDDSGFTYKKVNHLMMPFIIRKEKGEEPVDSDYVFKNESGQLCRFLKNPLIQSN